MRIKVSLDLSINVSQEIIIEASSQEDFNSKLEDAKQEFLDDNLPSVDADYDDTHYNALPRTVPMELWESPTNNLELPLGV